jgi:flagellar basal body rod protein FlgG
MPDPITMLSMSMNNDMYKMNNISQNISNVNTVGFKRNMPLIQSYDSINGIDNGFLQQSSVTDFSLGAMKKTGDYLDIAIGSEAMLTVSSEQGEFFTKRGMFAVNANGLLALPTGELVQGQGGNIRVGIAPFTIDSAGKIERDGLVLDQLALVKMMQPGASTYIGGGLYRSSQQNIVDWDENHSAGVKQGYVETSNVKPGDEMISMIELVRHFEASAKIIKGYDSMLGATINTLGDID